MTLDRYVIREVAVPFLLGLFALISIFLINQLVRLADLFVGHGVGLDALAKLLWVLLPPFLLVTLPAAALLAGIAAFARFSADGEFTALKSAGVSFARLMRPMLLFALIAGGVALWLGVTAEPWGKGKLKQLAQETLRAHAGVLITPGTFNDLYGNVVVYAEESESGVLNNIFISDERDPERPLLVTAHVGQVMQTGEENRAGLHLEGGEIHHLAGNSVQRIRFDTYDLKLHVSGGTTTPRWESVAAIRSEITRRQAAGEPHERLLTLWLDRTKNVTFGVTCFIFALLGPALGVYQARAGRSAGFAKGLIVILTYYALMVATQALVVGSELPVMVGAWVPNGLFALATAYALIRVQRDLRLLPFAGRGA
ncbi:MAG: LptF/LptG family permease [Leptospirillia bacterium]